MLLAAENGAAEFVEDLRGRITWLCGLGLARRDVDAVLTAVPQLLLPGKHGAAQRKVRFLTKKV